VVYVHTDGINTNVDVDVDWLTTELRKLFKEQFPDVEAEHISMDKEYFKEGVWLQIGNYVLRNEDGSLTKHGSTFKATSRSKFYLKVLDKIIDVRINNTVDTPFIEKLYQTHEYELEDFVMRRGMHRKKEDYKSETDLIINLINQGEVIGMNPTAGTTFFYVKTNTGYKLESTVDSLDEIDITYYWDTISNLLRKFGLGSYIKKKPPLTLIDKKQKSLMEWV